MNSKLWIQKALSLCLVVTTMVASSMVALANSERIAGEITVSGNSTSGETPFVKINGEASQSGRSVFSSSIIATPQDAGAIVNLGKLGTIELTPNTTFALTFDTNGINGELLAGQISVLNSSKSVNVKMLDGSTVSLNAGDTASTNANAQDDDNGNGGGQYGVLLFAIILGGATAGLVLAATSDNNRVTFGGSSTVTSPTR